MGFEGSEELQWTNCEGKWKSLTAAYRKTVDHKNRTGSDRRECAFFNKLSHVYGYRPTVHPVATSSSTGKRDSKSVQTREKEGDNTSPSPDDPSRPSTSVRRYTSFQVSSATRIPVSEYASFWELIFRVFRYP